MTRGRTQRERGRAKTGAAFAGVCSFECADLFESSEEQEDKERERGQSRQVNRGRTPRNAPSLPRSLTLSLKLALVNSGCNDSTLQG